MIKDMIVKLMEEANEEAEHKGWCDTELSSNKQTRDTKTTEAGELQAAIEQWQSEVETLSAEIATLAAEITAIDEAVAEATSQRQDEKAKNTATTVDAKAAMAAV